MSKRKIQHMKAVQYNNQPYKINVNEVRRPTIQDPLDAIVKVTSAGICGSEIHTYHGRSPVTDPPLTLGHEMVGIVDQVGAGVTTLKRGDRVVVFDGVSCGFCDNCLAGNRGYCQTVKPPFEGDYFGIPFGPGDQLDGGQAEYIRVPWAAETTILLPPGKERELDYLMLSDIFPTGWTCLDFSGFEAGDTVAVFGAGPVGLLCAYSAILRGASKVYVVDRVPARLAKAKEIGAIPIDFSTGDPVAQIVKQEPSGVDRACDCVGYECVDAKGNNVVNEVLVNAINVVKATGGIGVIGAYSPADPGAPTADTKKGILSLPWGLVLFKGLTIKAGPVTPHIHRKALKALIEAGVATPSFVIGKEISIDEVPETYREFSKREILKPVIMF